ncbi:hypothetical protein [Cylindrospermopsis raciborskii]|uniref:hypothetical protein n=1 Tax=Cylindrospermopsis raciborskii TaxID=77022 RepID=UPI00387A6891
MQDSTLLGLPKLRPLLITPESAVLIFSKIRCIHPMSHLSIPHHLNPDGKSKTSRTSYLLTPLLSGLFCLYVLSGLIGFIQTASMGKTGSGIFVATVIGLLFFLIEAFLPRRRYKLVDNLIGVLSLGLLLNPIINYSDNKRLIIVIIGDLPQILSGAGVALFLLRRPLASFVLPFTYFLFGSLVAFFTYFFYNGTDPNEIFLYLSRNGISRLFIIYSAIFYIITYKLNLRIMVLPAVITFIFSVMSYSRSGIISSTILLVGILLITLDENKKKYKFYIYIYMASFFGVLLMFFTGTTRVDILKIVYSNAHYFDRLQTRGLSDTGARELIWSRYVAQMDPTKFFFGTDPKLAFSNLGFGDYHNSFIQLHAMTGIAGLLFILFILLAIVKLFNLNEMLLLLVLISVVSRSFTDTGLFFNWHHGFVVYYLTFFAFLPKSSEALHICRMN